MIDGVAVKKINKYEDARGWLAEIYREDESDFRPAMSYVSVTRPSQVRGPHEHVRQSDCFVFVGPGDFRVFLWDRRDSSPTKGQKEEIEAGEHNPVMIIVPPGVVHGYKCVSEHDAYCINLPDKLYRGDGKTEKVDEIRWEDDPNSSYVIK